MAIVPHYTGSVNISGELCLEDGRVVVVKRALANPSASGDGLVVTGITGRRIRVIGCFLLASAVVSTKFRSNTTDIGPLTVLAANSGYVLPQNDHGWHQTEPGEALNLNLSGAVQVGVQVVYVEV